MQSAGRPIAISDASSRDRTPTRWAVLVGLAVLTAASALAILVLVSGQDASALGVRDVLAPIEQTLGPNRGADPASTSKPEDVPETRSERADASSRRGASDLLEPVTGTVDPAAETLVEPVVEPVTRTIEPVIDTVVEPMLETAIAPVTQTLEPVVATAIAPVTQTLEPVVATAIAPVTQTLEPVVATAIAPVTQTLEPVVEAVVEPVIRDVVEPIADTVDAPVGEAVESVVEQTVESLEPTLGFAEQTLSPAADLVVDAAGEGTYEPVGEVLRPIPLAAVPAPTPTGSSTPATGPSEVVSAPIGQTETRAADQPRPSPVTGTDAPTVDTAAAPAPAAPAAPIADPTVAPAPAPAPSSSSSTPRVDPAQGGSPLGVLPRQGAPLLAQTGVVAIVDDRATATVVSDPVDRPG
jgi:hypothetical protein